MNLNELLDRLKSERMREVFILALSILILAGSGISLGVGVMEIQERADLSPSVNSLTSSNELMNRSANEPIVDYPLNINTASAVELESLPGIGQTRAKAIVDYRQSKGAFKTIEEITSVPGIGPKTFERIKGLIMVGQ